MKRIINGVTYNTDTSTAIAEAAGKTNSYDSVTPKPSTKLAAVRSLCTSISRANNTMTRTLSG